MQGDADSEVARLAGEVQVREASRDHWAVVQAFEVTETERQQREDLQIQQEAREREEAGAGLDGKGADEVLAAAIQG